MGGQGSEDLTQILHKINLLRSKWYLTLVPEADRVELITNGNAISWTDVDVSNYVPKRAKAVLLSVRGQHIGGMKCDVDLRKNGSVITDHDKIVRIWAPASKLQVQAIVEIDDNKIFEYQVNGTQYQTTLTLHGYYESYD